ncbi:MAG TPA: AAA family ATPase [Verrucomicrobiae bacterium]|nr:AAA family ATPase [Verrucomicrobiae bacterium]
MKKILVTGNAGSGKSTLGKSLAAFSGLPYFGMDQIVWKENWQRASKEEEQKKVAELVAREAWIIDGVSYEVMAAADTIVFLDMPRSVCFWRAAKRNRKYLFASRPGLPASCPEILIVPKLIKIIWRFPKRVRPNILAEKDRRGTDFIHIRSDRDLKKYLAQNSKE